MCITYLQKTRKCFTYSLGAVFSYCSPGGISFVRCAISAFFSSCKRQIEKSNNLSQNMREKAINASGLVDLKQKEST